MKSPLTVHTNHQSLLSNLVAADIENIVACTRFPCSNTTGAVSCTNILAPAGGRINPQGRACACQDATRFYANDIDGCVGENRHC